MVAAKIGRQRTGGVTWNGIFKLLVPTLALCFTVFLSAAGAIYFLGGRNQQLDTVSNGLTSMTTAVQSLQATVIRIETTTGDTKEKLDRLYTRVGTVEKAVVALQTHLKMPMNGRNGNGE